MSEFTWTDEIAEFTPADQERIVKRINGNVETREVSPGVWEYTFTPAQVLTSPIPSTLGMLIPQLWTDALTRSLLNGLRETPFWQTYYRYKKEARKQHKRERRQHRATYRRRKRGLA